ncbi:MAG: DHH family phosphoesterase [Candidatus Micrarchaeota archaeon]
MRYNYGKKEYLITDGNSDFNIRSEEPLVQGSIVKIVGEIDQTGNITATNIVKIDDGQQQKILEKIKMQIKTKIPIANEPYLVTDELTKKIWPQLKWVAEEIFCAKKLGRGILLRFHGDADGVCGAFALTEIVYCKAFQQNSAMYNVKDAFRDISTIGQENRPLIILLDFGSSDSCKEALELVSAAGIEYIIIDHHPYQAKENTKIVNPFSIQENASKYTAGYLACEIAIACGLDKEKGKELAKVACAGDKSNILESDEDDGKKAMVLDFLTNHVPFGNNLEFYKKVMRTPDLFSSITQQANDSIEEAAGKALAKAKRTQENSVEICVFPLDSIVVKGEWPSSSKITTRVYDKIRDSVPLMCIGHTEYSVIMRINDEGIAKGLNANNLAEEVKKTMGDFVKGGGGHAKAGAISVRPGFTREVLGELLRQISTKLA